MSYGVSFTDLDRRCRYLCLDKILKGAKPADLPVEQPTKFELSDQSENRKADRCNHSAQRLGQSRPSYPVSEQSKIQNLKSEDFG